MLRVKFWSDLKDSELKNATRYTYDIIKNFDELRKEVRAVELELEISGASKPESTATNQPVSAVSEMNELLKTLELLNKRLDNYEGELKKIKVSSSINSESFKSDQNLTLSISPFWVQNTCLINFLQYRLISCRNRRRTDHSYVSQRRNSVKVYH
jgi:hypothetical protein